MDHRHSIHGLIKIFDHWLRADKIDPLVRLNHHRSFTGGVQVHELVAAFPRVLAHQFMADTLLGEDQADLARKGAERELEELPHGAAALAAKGRASSAADRSDRAYSRPRDQPRVRRRPAPASRRAKRGSPPEPHVEPAAPRWRSADGDGGRNPGRCDVHSRRRSRGLASRPSSAARASPMRTFISARDKSSSVPASWWIVEGSVSSGGSSGAC